MEIACPADGELRELIEARAERAGAERDRAAELEQHLEVCERCRERLDRLASAGLESYSLGSLAAGGGLAFLEPSSAPGSVGRFGPYEILSVIARGGMGIVLKARDGELRRTVAVKVLAPDLAARPGARARFLEEARAAAAVEHDNVVGIHAVAEASGLPYLVMPYLEGSTLEELVHARGPLAAVELVRLALQLARGLAAAHLKGLIHRDIKPANLLLESGTAERGLERIRIADFGLARTVEEGETAQGGHIAGTPQFMSPEQARGGPIDHRSDLFGAGCVLYFAATGRAPFDGNGVDAVLKSLAGGGPRSLGELASALPKELRAIIERLLEAEPGDRFPSAEALVSALEDYEARLRRRGRARRWALAAAGVLAVAAIVLILSRPRAPGGSSSAAAPAAIEASRRVRIERSGESFASLEEAVAASRSGDRLLLREKILVSAPIAIHGKALTLAAAPGEAPEITFSMGGEPAIATDAPLRLEDLSLRQEGKSDEGTAGPADLPSILRSDPMGTPRRLLPLVRSTGAVCAVVHCRIVRNRTAPRFLAYVSCFELAGCPRFELTRSELFNGEIRGVAVSIDAANLTGGGMDRPAFSLEGSLVIAAAAVEVRRARSPVSIHLRRNTLVSRAALLFGDDRLLEEGTPMKRIFLETEGNVFRSDTVIQSIFPSLDVFRSVIDWSDRGNLYSVDNEYLRSSAKLTDSPAQSIPRDLSAWQRFWGLGETGSASARLAMPRFLIRSPMTFAPDLRAFRLTAAEKRAHPAVGFEKTRDSP